MPELLKFPFPALQKQACRYGCCSLIVLEFRLFLYDSSAPQQTSTKVLKPLPGGMWHLFGESGWDPDGKHAFMEYDYGTAARQDVHVGEDGAGRLSGETTAEEELERGTVGRQKRRGQPRQWSHPAPATCSRATVARGSNTTPTATDWKRPVTCTERTSACSSGAISTRCGTGLRCACKGHRHRWVDFPRLTRVNWAGPRLKRFIGWLVGGSVV